MYNAGCISAATSEPLLSTNIQDLTNEEIYGIALWNDLFITTVKSPEPELNQTPDLTPLSASTQNRNAYVSENNNHWPTSAYLMGSVCVGIVFVESNGQLDPITERWTKNDQEDIAEQIYQGLDWWSDMGGYRANVSWTYDIQECKTRYEPINRTKDESPLWVNDCMRQLGYTHGEDYERVRQYADDLRNKYNTDWSFVVLAVSARNDSDGYFAEKSGIAWAYVGGPYMVISNKCNRWGYQNVWKVTAHETGHIFNALDEYAPLRSTQAQVISNVTDLNDSLRSRSDLCMMRSNELFLCERTRQQIGWIDRDQDGIFDSDSRRLRSPYHEIKSRKEHFHPVSKIIFSENFNGTNDWFEDGNNYIRNGAYVMYDSVLGSSSWLEKDYYDFTAQVKTQWEQGSAASGYGLMVRVKTATDGYIFFVNQRGQFAFGKYVNANWKYLVPWTYTDAIKIGEENVLKAICTGNRFQLYINEEKIAETFDATFIYGNIGLTVLPGVRVHFDDLTVFSP